MEKTEEAATTARPVRILSNNQAATNFEIAHFFIKILFLLSLPVIAYYACQHYIADCKFFGDVHLFSNAFSIAYMFEMKPLDLLSLDLLGPGSRSKDSFW